MLYRIAVYAGLFLLGYTLGRRIPQHPPAHPQPSDTSRIRDALEAQSEDTDDARPPRSGARASDPGESAS